jgi:hypothetical protein
MCDLIYDLMMRLNELIDTIIDTDYEDWTYDDEHGIRVLKADLSIFIQERRKPFDIESNVEPRTFDEKWATRFPDRKAYPVVFDLWFGNSLVKSYYFATVDGGRADLPYPRAADDLTITHEEYAVARAVNNGPSRVDFDRHILRFRVE